MNKSALKTFATNARRELLKKVEARAMKIGITEDNIKKADIESSDAIFIDGRQLSKQEKIQRDRLIDRIGQIGFKRVMEEVAYTWFNRFTALRFMEVNDYLPTKVRVLSSTNVDSTEPDMMKEALSLDLDLDKEYIYDLKMNNNSEELFKYLIIKHCNDLNRYMPFMFEKIDDYTEILFPEGLLATDSFLRYMTNTEVIPEDNWEEIEVIGWLYQYYIVEEKDQVFANLKKNIKITKDTLPVATQLFTPNWIVRYMVENSLGRIWLESYPDSHLKTGWKYYLNKARQDESVVNKLEKVSYTNVNPEEITFFDPCCGSGHILVYAFDIFYEMYLEKGYVESEIPQLILGKNLYGLDVDNRAAQIASFALMMKAREKSRRIFRKAIQPNIYAIQESNWLTDEMIDNVSGNDSKSKEILSDIRGTYWDAKEYGSLLNVKTYDYEYLENCLQGYKEKQIDLIEMIDKQVVEERMPLLLKQSMVLSQKYDVVCTNPPYMGRNGMNPNLTKFLDNNYPESKADLFSAFIERGFDFVYEKGFNSMVTMQSWMFLSSFEKLRTNIVLNKTIETLLHMDNMVMGIAFGTAATIIRNTKIDNYLGVFTQVKYVDVENKSFPNEFPIMKNRNGVVSTEEFKKIPGSPIAYWIDKNTINAFLNPSVGSKLTTREGMATADNDKFLKFWFEVEYPKVTFGCKSAEDALLKKGKWFPYNKGGSYRKWYGNNEYIVNWENDGYLIRNNKDEKTGRIRSHNYNGEYGFKEGITWSALSSGNISVRYSEEGYLFDSKGAKGFCQDNGNLIYILGLLNSKIGNAFLEFISPTMDFKVGDVIQIPLIFSQKEEIINLVQRNIEIAKNEWDSFETSWDFKQHPFVKDINRTEYIETSNLNWQNELKSYFENLKNNEVKINRVFNKAYNLSDENTSNVEDKEVSIRRPDLKRDVKSFISYAIGCTLGRYSLDQEGLVYAGGEFESAKYKTYFVDQDNVLPILPGSYFEDDIVLRFVDFVRVTFGEGTLTENLDFVAEALGRKKGETAKETLRRYFLNDFYKDHVKTYGKRPIYWLFTSGREKAFNCLIYMHRYDKTTLSRIRTDYLHDYQIRLDAEKKDLLNIIEGDSTAKEISNAKKELKSLDKKIEELKAYDELLHHMADMQIEIDLDDGVKVNYEKFKGLVAKI